MLFIKGKLIKCASKITNQLLHCNWRKTAHFQTTLRNNLSSWARWKYVLENKPSSYSMVCIVITAGRGLQYLLKKYCKNFVTRNRSTLLAFWEECHQSPEYSLYKWFVTLWYFLWYLSEGAIDKSIYWWFDAGRACDLLAVSKSCGYCRQSSCLVINVFAGAIYHLCIRGHHELKG